MLAKSGRRARFLPGRQRPLWRATGQKVYKAIHRKFVARESCMIACLDRAERNALMGILDKIIGNSSSWAKPHYTPMADQSRPISSNTTRMIRMIPMTPMPP